MLSLESVDTDDAYNAYNEWCQHDPFKRASPDLIRMIERYEKQYTKIESEVFFNNLEESLF